MTTFPAALKRARIQRGLSQYRLAEQHDLDPSFLSRLERGKRRPSRQYILTLAVALGCDDLETDELLLSAGELPQSAYMMREIDAAMTHRRHVAQKREAWEAVTT